MPYLFAVFEICHRSHSPLCSLFQIPKPTKIQVKIAQLILSPLLKGKCLENTRLGTLPNGYDNDCSGQWMVRRLVVRVNQTPTCQGIGPPKSSSPESPWQRSREMMLSVWCTSSMASCGVWHVSA